MSEVRSVSLASERDKLDNFAALRPLCMMEVWSAREKMVRPRCDVVRRVVDSVEVEWCISADAVESGTPIPENLTCVCVCVCMCMSVYVCMCVCLCVCVFV